MKNLFTVGEVAELLLINIRTLRYYDDIGVLHPKTTGAQTGYRYHTTHQSGRLNTIKYLYVLDMPLKEIALFFESRDMSIMQTLLEEQHREMLVRISQLMQVGRKLEYRLQSLEGALHTLSDVIRPLRFGQRQITHLRENIPLDDDLKYSSRELGQTNTLELVVLLGKVGVSTSAHELTRRHLESFSGISAFLEQEGHYHSEEHYLMAGDYLTVRFTGIRTEAAPCYTKLLDHVTESGYRCCGDSMEITLTDVGFTNNVFQYVTEIQIPVEQNY